MKKTILFTLLILLSACSTRRIVIPINKISADGVGEPIGKITLSQELYNVKLSPNLHSLPPGEHGFHLHEFPSCEPIEKDGKMIAGGAAGAHFDPDETKKHDGPEGEGHMGDLPKLIADENGNVTANVYIKKLLLVHFRAKSLVIHAGGDNYSDTPKPSGGGGDRIACGVIRWGS